MYRTDLSKCTSKPFLNFKLWNEDAIQLPGTCTIKMLRQTCMIPATNLFEHCVPITIICTHKREYERAITKKQNTAPVLGAKIFESRKTQTTRSTEAYQRVKETKADGVYFLW